MASRKLASRTDESSKSMSIKHYGFYRHSIASPEVEKLVGQFFNTERYQGKGVGGLENKMTTN